ncbi:MAG: gliding motility-associated C-terminal domain-containing protein [Saprospirales bacterium]|nr:gliding motility-associated C-terminal domain-containing protein [Saprospirales bacterium]
MHRHRFHHDYRRALRHAGLGSADICEIDGLFDLTALQDPLYPSGLWTGPGVTGNVFDPTGQSGSVTLTFTPAGSCANSADATIVVTASAQPVLSNATLCESDGPLDLSTLQDPNFPVGTWSGPGVGGSNFDPAGQSGLVSVTFTPSDTCFLAATASILVNQAPAIANLVELCDANNTTYTVSFEISGGDPGSYTVNGVSVTSPFLSAPIVAGDPYAFSVDDANGCGPVDVSGSVNCICTTSSGTMDTGAGPILVCQGFSINATDYFNNDAVLDPNDLQQFVLHDSPGPGLGNIVAISNTGFFVYPVNIVTFQSYYISVIAGNDDGTGNVNTGDPCFSASAGIEVIFTELSISFSSDFLICENHCYDWVLSFEGNPPFTFEYNISAGAFSQVETVVVFQNDTTLTFCPIDYGLSSGILELQPGDFSDALCSDPGSNLPPTLVTVSPIATLLIDPVLCPDEEITVNGTIYNMANPSGVESIPLATPDACDSIVTIQLSFFPPALGSIAQTLCDGESLVVNGTTYDAANPSGTEIFAGGSVNGCDSTVTINLGFYPPAQFSLSQTLCEGESIVVNGTVFDQANPSGVVVIPNGSFTGCDSTVTVALSFLPHSTSNIMSTLCPGGFLVVNGTTYNQANPAGVEFLQNGNYLGCDSTINVSLSFFPPSVGTFSSTLCEGESLVINGTLYDQNNPGGTELFVGGSYTGCDSTLQVSLSFVPNSVNNLSATLCLGESIVVNGVTYDQANPSGTEFLPNGNAAGCDSTINVSLSFFPPANGVLSAVLCAEDFVVINGTVYNSGNPSGTEVFPGGSANGCDSTLTIALSFLPPIEFSLIDTLVSGQFITVNGTIYNETNPNGTQVFFNGSFQGCDSTVQIQLFFEEFELEFSTLAPSCFGFQDGQFVIEGISGGKPPYSVSIDGIFFEPLDTFPFVWSDLPAGSYQLTVQDANGETYLINIVIPSKVEPLLDLGPDLELELGEGADLEAVANFPVAQINWLPSTWLDCDTCLLTTLIAPQTDITYTVTALDPDGCPATDFLSVRVLKLRKLFIPSVFSPNADGANDLFVIYAGVEVRQIREFQVYNRWGSLMYRASNFQPNDPAFGWDGYFQDRLMDVGVYVYYAEVEFVDGVVEVVKGGVTLVR